MVPGRPLFFRTLVRRGLKEYYQNGIVVGFGPTSIHWRAKARICVEGDRTHELKLVAMKGVIKILRVVYRFDIFVEFALLFTMPCMALDDRADFFFVALLFS